MKKGRVMVAMSGGVDSSVAAFLLKEEGYEVAGATMLLWPPLHENQPPSHESRPPPHPENEAPPSAMDAARVCERLAIPHHLIDFREAFKEKVVDYFSSEYREARTPNPCIRCNRRIKFGLLMEQAREMGYPYLATGHYARIERDPRFPGPVLKKGLDSEKDQSYALFDLRRDRLEQIVLPMGALPKTHTRTIAQEAGLHVSDREESQDICFIPDGDYGRFLVERCDIQSAEGLIKNPQGEVLGRHRGLIHYTIGQRRGLGIAAKRPLYVVELRPGENTLVVGFEEEIFSKRFRVRELNWLVPAPDHPIQTRVKIRYASDPFLAQLVPEFGERATIVPDEPQKAVTPGQAAVFYEKDLVLGGGWIE